MINKLLKKSIISTTIICTSLLLTFFHVTPVTALEKETASKQASQKQTDNNQAIKKQSENKQSDSKQKISNNQQTILILQSVEHPALDATRRGILDELKKAGISASYEIAQNNSALAAQIAQKYISQSPPAVIGIPTLSAQALVAANRSANIPIVFSSVTDPLTARLVSHLKNQKENVTGVSNFVAPDKQFAAFKNILPEMKTVGIIYNPGEANSVSLNEAMKKAAANYDINLVFAVANNSVDVPQATRQLLTKVDAIFINNDNTALSAFEAISKIAKEKKVPVFVSDTDLIGQGALAALGPNQYEIGRQTAKLLLQILQGEKAQNLPILFPEETELFINIKVAKELGIPISDSLLQTEGTKVFNSK